MSHSIFVLVPLLGYMEHKYYYCCFSPPSHWSTVS